MNFFRQRTLRKGHGGKAPAQAVASSSAKDVPSPKFLTAPTFQQLLSMVDHTQDVECACEDAFEVLDRFVEMVRSGTDVSVVMPLVQQHLHVCSCCREHYEALLRALEASS